MGEIATLDLVVKKEYYDLIKSGVKKEVYRDLKEYWVKRLVNNINDCVLGQNNLYIYALMDFKTFNVIKVRNSSSNAETLLFNFEGISVGRGKTEWGAPKTDTFIIKLGNLIKE